MTTEEAIYQTAQGILADPHDDVSVHAHIDAQIEAGVKPLTAKRNANRVQRESLRLADERAAKAVLASRTAAGQALRHAIRLSANVTSARVPIAVCGGKNRDLAPLASGEAGHSVFRGGGACRHAGAAIRAGCKVDYVASTLEVLVGIDALVRAWGQLKGVFPGRGK